MENREDQSIKTPEKQETLAIISFVLSLLSLFCFGFPAAIAAIVCAVVDRRQRGRFEGYGLAGFIIAIAYCALTLLSILFAFFIFGSMLFFLEFLASLSGGLWFLPLLP